MQFDVNQAAVIRLPKQIDQGITHLGHFHIVPPADAHARQTQQRLPAAAQKRFQRNIVFAHVIYFSAGAAETSHPCRSMTPGPVQIFLALAAIPMDTEISNARQ